MNKMKKEERDKVFDNLSHAEIALTDIVSDMYSSNYIPKIAELDTIIKLIEGVRGTLKLSGEHE